jgi:hypothetical protein
LTFNAEVIHRLEASFEPKPDYDARIRLLERTMMERAVIRMDEDMRSRIIEMLAKDEKMHSRIAEAFKSGQQPDTRKTAPLLAEGQKSK